MNAAIITGPSVLGHRSQTGILHLKNVDPLSNQADELFIRFGPFP
jgi:hypothetical protein